MIIGVSMISEHLTLYSVQDFMNVDIFYSLFQQSKSCFELLYDVGIYKCSTILVFLRLEHEDDQIYFLINLINSLLPFWIVRS